MIGAPNWAESLSLGGYATETSASLSGSHSGTLISGLVEDDPAR